MRQRRAIAALAGLGWLASACSNPTEPGFGDTVVYDTHREVEVRFRSDDGTVLVGALLLPPEPATTPLPAVVAHFGSDRWERSGWNGWTMEWIRRRIAVFTYDKRGVGESGGECCPWRDPGYFPLLAEDVRAAVEMIGEHPEIDAGRIGLYGYSQGGWVIPIAAAALGDRAAFTMIGSGPTVSLGEEVLYSNLTGDDTCTPSGLSAEELERRLDEAGPSAFQPRLFLEQMTAPALWFYGGNDTSIPVARSIRILEEIEAAHDRDFTILFFPTANHVMIDGGGMCQTSGQTVDWVTPSFDWVEGVLGISAAISFVTGTGRRTRGPP